MFRLYCTFFILRKWSLFLGTVTYNNFSLTLSSLSLSLSFLFFYLPIFIPPRPPPGLNCRFIARPLWPDGTIPGPHMGLPIFYALLYSVFRAPSRPPPALQASLTALICASTLIPSASPTPCRSHLLSRLLPRPSWVPSLICHPPGDDPLVLSLDTF